MLIVDDEASVVDSLADTLPWQDLGIVKVFKAYSGFEALEILTTNSIDIMLTDIRMPGMSGLELLEQVHRNWKKTKCILLSGHAEFTYAQQAIQHNTYEYLLKPISDPEIISKVKGVVELVEKEREENQSYLRAVKAFEESLPKLREDLLHDLLQGKKVSVTRLADQLEMLKIPIKIDDMVALMLVRLEDRFTNLDFYSLSLMEYAVGNMAVEIFGDYFTLWQCKDVHDYLVFLVSVTEEKGREREVKVDGTEVLDNQLHLMASQLQLSVNHYLKGTVSVLVSQWGRFPGDVNKVYQGAIASFRRQVGNQKELFISVSNATEQLSVNSLQRLYQPPLLIHLLESGDWGAIQDKLTNVFHELSDKWGESHEHLIEAFFFIYASFSSFAHNNGRELAEMIGSLSDVTGLVPGRSITSLRNWTLQAFERLQKYMESETKNDRESAVRKIQAFVKRYLVEDVSLHAIADHMYMHPVHVSRIYKLETGENLSDYVFRLKMEKAASFLSTSSLKIYEIALQLGYQNPNYFIKVFKKYYSLTPHDFRLKIGESR